MSALTSLARAYAVDREAAQPITTVRHVHIAERPLVFVPLTLTGEANAPLAALVGSAPDDARLLVVPQPRNRSQRFAFAASLAEVVVPYVDSFCGTYEQVREDRMRYRDAPQILVANPAAVGFVRLFGRSTRFRRTYGEYGVRPGVPILGRWLTFFAERAEHPGSSMLLAATSALAMHWATGQSAVEDADLAALLGWIDPPPGVAAFEAAAAAEDPLVWPPAGPATDPTFDNEVLAPLVAAYDRATHDRAADDDAARRRALSALESALHGQAEPTWRLMWRSVDLLRSLPPGARVASRWAADRDAFTSYVSYLRDGGLPQPRRDGAVAAAIRLDRLERAQAGYDAQRALDDPLVMAEHRLVGEAFAGVVVAVSPDRVDGTGPRRRLRPHITVLTQDPVRLGPGTVVAAAPRPAQKGQVLSVSVVHTGVEVVLELSGGMGRSLTAPPGSVPAVGERLCYSVLVEAYQPAQRFPSREQTPWTHGGPPVEYVPTDEDAVEEWS